MRPERVDDAYAVALMPGKLTVLYDEQCGVCVRARDWLAQQQQLVHLELVPAGGPVAAARYSQVPWLGAELVVVSDKGAVWVGPAAFLMCLWSLRKWRAWSYRLSGTALRPLARWFFETLSTRRGGLGRMVGVRCDSKSCRSISVSEPRRPW